MINRIVRVLALLPVMLFVVLVTGSCRRAEAPERFDASYSEFLTSLSGNYTAITGEKSADTVDAVQIYRIPSDRFEELSLEQVRAGELAYETRDKAKISLLFQALQAQSGENVECNAVSDKITLHMLAFDNSVRRIGYILIRRCMASQNEPVVVKSLQGPGRHTIY